MKILNKIDSNALIFRVLGGLVYYMCYIAIAPATWMVNRIRDALDKYDERHNGSRITNDD